MRQPKRGRSFSPRVRNLSNGYDSSLGLQQLPSKEIIRIAKAKQKLNQTSRKQKQGRLVVHAAKTHSPKKPNTTAVQNLSRQRTFKRGRSVSAPPMEPPTSPVQNPHMPMFDPIISQYGRPPKSSSHAWFSSCTPYGDPFYQKQNQKDKMSQFKSKQRYRANILQTCGRCGFANYDDQTSFEDTSSSSSASPQIYFDKKSHERLRSGSRSKPRGQPKYEHLKYARDLEDDEVYWQRTGYCTICSGFLDVWKEHPIPILAAFGLGLLCLI